MGLTLFDRVSCRMRIKLVVKGSEITNKIHSWNDGILE